MNIDERIDYIFETVDELLLKGKFETVDRYIESQPDNLPPVLAIAILTITRPAKSKLKKRAEFYNKYKYLGNRKLDGLE